MKKRVELSTASVIITSIIVVMVGGLFWRQLNNDVDESGQIYVWCILGALSVWCSFSLFYSPLYIAVNDKSLEVVRSLRIKSIPLGEIENVKLCPPTLGERCIFGSDGFVGYWGWFSDRELGKYFAYYGKASDCMLVTLKDGKKYMLGCKDARDMAAEINRRIEIVQNYNLTL